MYEKIAYSNLKLEKCGRPIFYKPCLSVPPITDAKYAILSQSAVFMLEEEEHIEEGSALEHAYPTTTVELGAVTGTNAVGGGYTPEGSNSTDSEHEVYKCKFCSKTFRKRASLGGHVSKGHPGQSEEYQRRQKIREDRLAQRRLHQLSMEIYRQQHGYEGRGTNRYLLSKIKKMLLKERSSDLVS